jgi:hypothetical protein
MQFTPEDQGKSVFDADREKIGVVVEVRNGDAYVEPEPSLGQELKAKLDWGDPEPDEDAYRLRGERIDRIDDKEIILRNSV